MCELYPIHFLRRRKKNLNFSYILNDSCSTSIVTNNLEMITNVRDCVENEIIEITTNGGGMKFDKIGRFKLFTMNVYYNKSYLATIISLLKLKTLEEITIKKDTKRKRPCVYM